ncbi:MAG: transposase [Rickettsiales bacterium]|jgi:transposase InsO family protein|nr:transposase [Rickettsiales bacterium]
MREEFYENDKPLKLADSLGAFRNKLKEFVRKYNSYRPHRELNYAHNLYKFLDFMMNIVYNISQ